MQKSMGYVLSLDQGTTGTTALVIEISNKSYKILAQAAVDFPQYYPKPQWVEHDLEEIWQSVLKAIAEVLQKAKLDSKKLDALGITNQRETLCVFDKDSGKPLHPGIVWQCKRSLEICKNLIAEGKGPWFSEQTGLRLDPYFSGTKLKWIMNQHPDLKIKLQNGQALWGTIDTYLLYRLTGGKSYATDASNASRTLMMSLASGDWDPTLLESLGTTGISLPEIKNSSGLFGVVHESIKVLPEGLPITGVLGDQQAALAGQACFLPGDVKCTYGTGAFALANIGEKPRSSNMGLLTTVAWKYQDKLTYALEGSAFIAGAAVQFLRDQLKLVHSPEETDLVNPVLAAPDIIFVPALSGLGTPWWAPQAKGAIMGLTRGTTREQIIQATLEGIAFQVNDIIESIAKDFGSPLAKIRVDGGASQNALLMRLQAHISGITVERPKNLESTALGAAFFAALGVGFFRNFSEIKELCLADKVFAPSHKGLPDAKLMKAAWTTAVRNLL